LFARVSALISPGTILSGQQNDQDFAETVSGNMRMNFHVIGFNLGIFQTSRHLTPLVNRNLPTLGSPVIKTCDSLPLRSKATKAAVKEVEKPGLLMRTLKKIHDRSRSVSAFVFKII